jgi:hypothetical protein
MRRHTMAGKKKTKKLSKAKNLEKTKTLYAAADGEHIKKA